VRRHVYLFLMNGIDPLGAGNLSGLVDHIHNLGFTQTYYGQLYHRGWMEREMKRIAKEDHDARLVLIGYGCGASTLCNLGQRLAASGMCVDMLIALGAEDEKLDGPFPICRLGEPSFPETMARVARELGHCASRVTVVEPEPPPALELGPKPRPVPPSLPQSFGPDWDSMKPRSELITVNPKPL
jgi:hypothetical protein